MRTFFCIAMLAGFTLSAAASAQDPRSAGQMETVEAMALGGASSPGDAMDARLRPKGSRESTFPLIPPGEPESGDTTRFALYAEEVLDQTPIQRLGYEWLKAAQGPTSRPGQDAGAVDGSRLVPPGYVIGAGDTVVLQVSGGAQLILELDVTRTGELFIPRVGSVAVGGLPFRDLEPTLRRALDRVYRDYQLSASLANIRGLQVQVTGYAAQPGRYTVSALSSAFEVLVLAGGPSAAGSYRRILLRRQGQADQVLDLYAAMLRGDTSGFPVLRDDDVLQIEPVGPQVAMGGAIRAPLLIEIASGETIAEVLRWAGGADPTADATRIGLTRRTAHGRGSLAELRAAQFSETVVLDGDVIEVFSALKSETGIGQKPIAVTISGEVRKPGTYVLPPQASLGTLLKMAGGLSETAYVFGADLRRRSAVRAQQANLDRALQDFELSIERQAATSLALSAEDVAENQRRSESGRKLLEKLKAAKPTGRMVLFAGDAQANQLPELSLEDGDTLLIPPRPSIVGVFGAVYSEGVYLYSAGRELGDYLQQAGGARSYADRSEIFVLRADGTVRSARQFSWWTSGLDGLSAMPGDTLFVPVDTDRGQGWKIAKDFAQIMSQIGLGAAAIKVLGE